MTTENSALDSFKMDFEDMPDKRRARIQNKQPKADQKKAKKIDRVRRPRKPSAFSLFFKYWVEVVLA